MENVVRSRVILSLMSCINRKNANRRGNPNSLKLSNTCLGQQLKSLAMLFTQDRLRKGIDIKYGSLKILTQESETKLTPDNSQL